MYDSQELLSSKSSSQLDMYLDEPRMKIKENAKLDILDYWKGNAQRYPQLSTMALDILSIPITTVASESTFSIGAQIISKYRTSILPENAEALVCARDWLNCYGGKFYC